MFDVISARSCEIALHGKRALALNKPECCVGRDKHKRDGRKGGALEKARDDRSDHKRDGDERVNDAQHVPCCSLADEGPPEVRAVACALVEQPVREAANRASRKKEPRRIAPTRNEQERCRSEYTEDWRQNERVREVTVELKRKRGICERREKNICIGNESAREARNGRAAPDARAENRKCSACTEKRV
jgi:hypothetical protein